jgi:hypothetical protein
MVMAPQVTLAWKRHIAFLPKLPARPNKGELRNNRPGRSHRVMGPHAIAT